MGAVLVISRRAILDVFCKWKGMVNRKAVSTFLFTVGIAATIYFLGVAVGIFHGYRTLAFAVAISVLYIQQIRVVAEIAELKKILEKIQEDIGDIQERINDAKEHLTEIESLVS